MSENERAEDEIVTETTTFVRTTTHGNQLEQVRRVLSSARKTAASFGLEIFVSVLDDLNAALAADEQGAADATARVNASLSAASAQLADAQAQLAAAVGQEVTEDMVAKIAAVGTALGAIDAAATPPPPPPPAWVQGTNADGTPMVDANGVPVDQSGNPKPAGA